MEIKEYLQELLDKWNKYDELDGFTADSFRNDLEKLLEYWDLRIKEEPVRIFYAGDMCVGSSNKPKKQPEKQEEWREEDWKLDIRTCLLFDNKTQSLGMIMSHEQIRDLEDFISKLLSERQQKGWMEGFDEGTSVEKELSNLLN